MFVPFTILALESVNGMSESLSREEQNRRLLEVLESAGGKGAIESERQESLEEFDPAKPLDSPRPRPILSYDTPPASRDSVDAISFDFVRDLNVLYKLKRRGTKRGYLVDRSLFV